MQLTLDAPIVAADENAAADALFDTLYSELHRLARRELARQGPIAGLGVTTLLHEAYLDHLRPGRRWSSPIARASWPTRRA